MKKLLLLAAFVVTSAQAQVYDWRVTRVVDGDTVEFQAPWLPDPLPKKLSIRVLGVDTPEKPPRAKCEQEGVKALAASAFTKKVITDAKATKIELKEWDKYGGRVLGDVFVDGVRLSELLIKNGHARPYHGEAKSSWCN